MKKSKKIDFIYWFAYYNEDSPSVRYRAKYPLEFFKEHYNINSALIIPGYKPKKILSFLKYFLSALLTRKNNSLIVVQRVHSNFIYSSLLKLLVTVRKKDTVYDLDDSDYLYCPPKSIYVFAKKCNHIAAGSRAIADHLSKFNDNIVITSSPTPDLNILKEQKNKEFTIGWIGGYGGDHKESLIDLVYPAIKKANIKCKFIVLGVTKEEDEDYIRNYFASNTNIEIDIPRNVDWKDEYKIQKTIATFDIGISTLLNNEIQRSKSGIKAKQYLNNGVPVLGTKLPENDWVIKDGINGYYCNSTIEFKKRIEEFYFMDNETYNRFSINSKETISAFNHEKYHEQLMGILQH